MDRYAAQTSQQNQILLKLYTGYRVALSFLLLLMFFVAARPLVGHLKPVLFTYVGSAYLLINVVALITVLRRDQPFKPAHLFIYLLGDVLALMAIADSTGGITSGVAILLVVVIAAASILQSAQLATLTAALASIAVIADTVRLISQGHLTESSLLPAGMLGMVMFLTSFAIQNVSRHIRRSEQLVQERAADVYKLEELNHLIVQRMHTGIVVANRNGEIVMANQASAELLGIASTAPHPDQHNRRLLPSVLANQLQHWLKCPSQKTPPFRTTPTGPELIANFSALHEQGDVLIFLDDNRNLIQRAQQIKLASLGRLTASIAHEIRNPLGAISHAAQLMEESPNLDKADLRLNEIIRNHCLRMNQIIENVLQLSRRNNAAPVRLVLAQWLEDFCQQFNDGRNQHAKLIIDDQYPGCEVTMDPSQLQQVLSNLIENGLRYSEQATGEAKVKLEISRADHSDMAQLDVIDFGAGISDANHETVFEPFFTTENSGTGLGLFIAKEMCEANQARLNYLRKDGQYSCFRINFPHPDRRTALEAQSPTNE